MRLKFCKLGEFVENKFYESIWICVNTCTPDGEFEFHMQMGSKLYPEWPSRFRAESMLPTENEFRAAILICS